MASKSWLLGIATVGVIGSAFLSAACTSETPPPPDSSASNLDGQSGSTSKPSPAASASSTTPPKPSGPNLTSSGPTPSASSSGGPTPTSTGGDDDDDACSIACDNAHPTATKDFDDLEDTCLCAPTRCATACAQSACSDADNAPDPVDGDACSACIAKFENGDGTGECDTQISAALKAKGGDDAALQACYDACP